MNNFNEIHKLLNDLKYSINQNQKKYFYTSLETIQNWTYIPNPSKIGALLGFKKNDGLSISTLTPEQYCNFENILSMLLSPQGVGIFKAAFFLEKNNSLKFRGLRDWLLFNYSQRNYTIKNYSDQNLEVYQIQGHHFSMTIELNIKFSTVKLKPIFFGSTLNHIQMKDREIKPLQDIVNKLTQFTSTLTDQQKEKSFQYLYPHDKKQIPRFNLLGPNLWGRPSKHTPLALRGGLDTNHLADFQKEKFLDILLEYSRYFSLSVEFKTLHNLTALNQHLSYEFIWCGSNDLSTNQPYYFRIQNSKMVLEFNTTRESHLHYHLYFTEYN
jgi:Protein of unknown function (DUF3500)